MGIDSRGVLRGGCMRCGCTDFSTKSIKCRCGHAPTVHVDLSSSSQHLVNVSGGSTVDKPLYSKAVGNSAISPPTDVTHLNQFHHNRDGMQHCYKCSITYPASVGACPSCHPRGNCENSLCNNLKYYDSRYGPFPYCSPSCRDQHLLPGYNQKLREHIESANNSASLLNQQIYKQDAKIEKCVCVGSEPITATIVDVSTSVCSDQELLSKYGTNNENDKDPSSSASGSLPDNSINASKDLIVTGMMPSDVLSPPMDNHENLVLIKSLPQKLSCVHFYNESWNVDDKYGLYVTGLTLGEETELELGDLIICDSTGMDFTKFTSPSIMTTLVGGSSQVKIFRKHEMKKIHQKINKVKYKSTDDAIAFLLPNKPEAQVFGIKPREFMGTVIISAVDKSIAQRSGIKEGDIVQFIGTLKDSTGEFTLTQVTKVDQVTTTCTELKMLPSAIGLILIIKREISTAV